MVTKEKRWIQHNFKTTEAEDAVIRQKMKAFGITNQSSYLRAMALKGYLLKLNLPEIRELIDNDSARLSALREKAVVLNEKSNYELAKADRMKKTFPYCRA